MANIFSNIFALPTKAVNPSKSYANHDKKLLDEIKESLNEIDEYYKNIYWLWVTEFEQDKLYEFNILTMLNDRLSFYNNHVNSFILDTVINTKMSKIISNDVTVMMGDEPIDFVKTLNDITKNLLAFNKTVVLLNQWSPDINQSKIKVVNPCFYSIYENDLRMYYYNNDGKIIYETRTQSFSESGVEQWYITQSTVDFEDNVNSWGKSDVKYTLIYDTYVTVKPFFEIVTQSDKSDILKIRELILAYDYTETQRLLEVKLTKSRLFADREYVESIEYDADFIEVFDTPHTKEPIFNLHQPTIRSSGYHDILDNYLQSIARNIGINVTLFGVIVNRTVKTATQTNAEDTTTVDTINGFKMMLQQQLNEYFGLWWNLDFDLKSYNMLTPDKLIELSQNATLPIYNRVALENPSITDIDELMNLTVRYKVENDLHLLPNEIDFAIAHDIVDDTYII